MFQDVLDEPETGIISHFRGEIEEKKIELKIDQQEEKNRNIRNLVCLERYNRKEMQNKVNSFKIANITQTTTRYHSQRQQNSSTIVDLLVGMITIELIW